ncbi:Holliday junction branch migration protein RuvA [Candidatus Nitrotoga arctica]|uniref:Holliday junction branch migration complex subunit RuvA n=1 Tax=Candidatus Nitrotoga arctica TaxID=453162 RepID=A0ABM8Z0Z9_9PROT|nr:Holliday junction branch migration protein RuvA [Candidatus Nitrotoga arctica]CAG9933495.1 Holliday junction branch migration complex subunit RuvA [Candidatus Nitrotoga arctica]
MIGRLTGNLLEKNPPQILLDVQGVGYEVNVPMSTFYNLPVLHERVVLYTQLIVREDAHLLYGFASEDERAAFRHLLKISGVGPKLALSVLSGLSLNDLAIAVTSKEVGLLTRIPGVGKKTAERLLLELQDKFIVSMSDGTSGVVTPHGNDITNALLALGYSGKEADWAAKQLPADANVSDGIRQALKLLSKA